MPRILAALSLLLVTVTAVRVSAQARSIGVVPPWTLDPAERTDLRLSTGGTNRHTNSFERRILRIECQQLGTSTF